MMKRTQLNITAVLGAIVIASVVGSDARAQATKYYPPSPRSHYTWRPAVTTGASVRPVAHTAAVLPPPTATPITSYQPAQYQPVATTQPTIPANCCGNTGCLGQTFAPTTYADPYAPATFAPTAPTVKAYRPLVNLVPPPPTYTVGQGLWGQSKVYLPNQHIRNTIRYLTP